VCARPAVGRGVLACAVFAGWVVLVGATPWRVRAQSPAACELRASASAAPFAEVAGRGAARRLARPLTVGAPLEDDTPRALGPCVVGLTRVAGGLRIFAADTQGALREVEVGDDGDPAATARALAVALSTLLLQLEVGTPTQGNPANSTQGDATNPPPRNPMDPPQVNTTDPANPTPTNPVNPAPQSPTEPASQDAANPANGEGGSSGNPLLAEPGVRWLARLRPQFVGGLHARATSSPLRGTAGAGLGGLVGLCLLERLCALVSAEYVLPDERGASEGIPVSYRWGNAAAVAQLDVLRRWPWALAAGLGVVARLSELSIDGRTTRGASLSGGMRVQVEGSVALARVWSLVLGLGTDLYVDRAAYVKGGQALLVEDFVTPWASFSLRFQAP
jgi:hypothetical protein